MLNFPVIPASEARPVSANASRIVPGLVSGLVSAGTAAAWVAWRQYRRWKTVRELRALDDRMLRDIGLDRSDIEAVISSGTTDRRAFERLGR